jgi:hypothetical protein
LDRDAKLAQADVARGADPSAERKARLRSPTIKELGERFLKEHVALHCKPTTHYDYTNLLKKVVNPVLGGIKTSEINFLDIQALHLKRRETPYQANRAVMVLSKMLTPVLNAAFGRHARSGVLTALGSVAIAV